MREYKTLKSLLKGEIVEIDNKKVRMTDEKLKEGDTYVCERNTGPKLRTVKYVDKEHGYIVANEPNTYPYDICECIKVKILET